MPDIEATGAQPSVDGGGAPAMSIEDIAADVMREYDADADDAGSQDGAQAAETATGDEPQPDEAPQQGAQQEASDGESQEDFLQGVTLEELLEGIEDEQQRKWVEGRYKLMLRHFNRRTQELVEAKKAAEQQAQQSPDVAALQARLQQLESMLAAQQPKAQEQQDDPVQRFIYAGIDRLLTPEEAIESPENMAEFVRQQAIIEARKAQLPTLKATYEKMAALENAVYQQAYKESEAQIEELFRDVPQYRTPEVEAQIAAVMEANPAIGLEEAFYMVLGPRLREDSYLIGQRIGEVKARKMLSETAEKRAKMSVPSSGGVASEGAKEPPKGATLDDILRYAIETADTR